MIRNKQSERPNEDCICAALLLLIFYYEHHLRPNQKVKIHFSVNKFTIKYIYAMLKYMKDMPFVSKYIVQLFCLWIAEVKTNFFHLIGNQQKQRDFIFDRIF
uniref:Predicted protein n=1 Tax=Hordeum vulgare subsp. vulgare TaxID=112509 RepID=F2E5J2_HORVV|nr:predicted protein [Hordeum vulgare subsp. vulgare]